MRDRIRENVFWMISSLAVNGQEPLVMDGYLQIPRNLFVLFISLLIFFLSAGEEDSRRFNHIPCSIFLVSNPGLYDSKQIERQSI